ncbi:MAG: zinc-ribbon domain-containing protein [bacterium]|nr:zinc-ribbon domain-containing protein [bacterium]
MTSTPHVCPQCQTPLLPNAKFCVKCGQNLHNQAEPEKQPADAPKLNSQPEAEATPKHVQHPPTPRHDAAAKASSPVPKPTATKSPRSERSARSFNIKYLKTALGGLAICASCFYGGNKCADLWLARQDTATVLARVKTTAQNGDTDSQLLLATLQRYGLARASSPDETEQYLASAAQQLPQAQYQLALWQRNTRADGGDATAFSHLEAAANSGSSLAMLELSRHYLQNKQFNADFPLDEEWIVWLSKSAQQGNIDAQCLLGQHFVNVSYLYPTEETGLRNLKVNDAENWLSSASERGSAKAKYYLACLYRDNPSRGKGEQGLKMLTELAESGYAPAQCELGRMYLKGQSISADASKAQEWLNKAASQNCEEAQYQLSLMYLDGQGVNKDLAKALDYMRQASLLGSAAAQNRLGIMYLNGSNVNKNYRQAYAFLKQAAVQGDTEAQFWLACLCDGLNGKKVSDPGIPKDLRDKEKALQWLTNAAEQGNIDAQLALGQRYRQGKLIKADGKLAETWLTKAMAQGSSAAMLALAEMYEQGSVIEKNGGKAVELYAQAAKQGNIQAMNHLGELYEKGTLVERSLKKAVEYYTQAAKRNSPEAKCHLGKLYEKGQGVTKNMAKARSLYEQAAKQGSARAQYCLGNLYEKGQGVNKNIGKALQLYEKAAQQKDPEALAALAALYYVGEVVPLDVQKSINYYNAAAKRGHVASMGMMGHFYESGEGGVPRDMNKARAGNV